MGGFMRRFLAHPLCTTWRLQRFGEAMDWKVLLGMRTRGCPTNLHFLSLTTTALKFQQDAEPSGHWHA